MNKLLSKKEKKKIVFQKIKAKEEEEEEEEGNYQPYLYDSLDDPAYFVIISHILKCTEEFGCKVIQLNSIQFNLLYINFTLFSTFFYICHFRYYIFPSN